LFRISHHDGIKQRIEELTNTNQEAIIMEGQGDRREAVTIPPDDDEGDNGNDGNVQDEDQVMAGAEDGGATQQQQQEQELPNPQGEEPVLDGYDRAELIGEGAYGVVFKGHKRTTGEVVAIKRIPFGAESMEGRSGLIYIQYVYAMIGD
jgi:hypothetical protein